MKSKITFLALTLIASVAFFGCKKEDHISPSNTSSVISNGEWKVASFKDDGKDETAHFSGYTFKFESNGAVIAVKSSGTSTGSWSSGKDDSHTEIVISFPLAPLNELNEDWHVLKQSSTSIEMEHISGGNGGTDQLTFQR
jgi:hypothetical protein